MNRDVWSNGEMHALQMLLALVQAQGLQCIQPAVLLASNVQLATSTQQPIISIAAN